MPSPRETNGHRMRTQTQAALPGPPYLRLSVYAPISQDVLMNMCTDTIKDGVYALYWSREDADRRNTECNEATGGEVRFYQLVHKGIRG